MRLRRRKTNVRRKTTTSTSPIGEAIDVRRLTYDVVLRLTLLAFGIALILVWIATIPLRMVLRRLYRRD
jgi:hypothetical protein